MSLPQNKMAVLRPFRVLDKRVRFRLSLNKHFDMDFSLRTYDLSQFQSELHNALAGLEGNARFSPLELAL